MLRDSLPTYQTPDSRNLSLEPNHEVNLILSFIDNYISGFSSYYSSINDSEKENRISDILVHHLELCKTESGGYYPFRFSKNPTQSSSTKETDIGVFVMSRTRKPIPILEFEAKRFSKSSNNKEYVCGARGGIERFKRNEHSSHLKICGMFGYVQYKSSSEWIYTVNNWIGDLAKNNSDKTIDWRDDKEKLAKVDSFVSVEKLYSLHVRKSSGDKIVLWHYMIELLSKN